MVEFKLGEEGVVGLGDGVAFLEEEEGCERV